jgi:hypothetical protein
LSHNKTKNSGKYLVRKVSKQGEDAEVSKEDFDALLDKMIRAQPQTNVDVVARRTKKENSGD